MSRLLSVIDERLELRAALNLPGRQSSAAPDGASRRLPSVLEAGLDTGGLQQLAAPFFNPSQAGILGRLGKAILNAPLRLLGRPQLYFNDEVRRVLATWSDVLHAVLDSQAALTRELAAQRKAIDEIGESVRRLGAAHPPDPGTSPSSEPGR